MVEEESLVTHGGSAEAGTTGVARVLRQPSIERGEPRVLWLEDGESLDHRWAHDERGLFPTRAIQRQPCGQRDNGRHGSPPRGMPRQVESTVATRAQ
jgi:hypothetical protein